MISIISNLIHLPSIIFRENKILPKIIYNNNKISRGMFKNSNFPPFLSNVLDKISKRGTTKIYRTEISDFRLHQQSSIFCCSFANDSHEKETATRETSVANLRMRRNAMHKKPPLPDAAQRASIRFPRFAYVCARICTACAFIYVYFRARPKIEQPTLCSVWMFIGLGQVRKLITIRLNKSKESLRLLR